MSRRVPHPDAPQLSDLVDDPHLFVETYLYQQPYLGSRITLAALPSAESLWESFLTRGTRQPAFRIVRAGHTTGRTGVTRAVGIGNRRPNDVIDPNAVIERYCDGDTVVLQALHQTDPHLAKLATNLSLALDQPTQVNAYLSPPHDQGLDIHFDYHDVIVVQLAGSKAWKIWEPLDHTVSPVRNAVKTSPLSADKLGEPRFELTLGAGDVLYLPRGFPHVATTTDECSDHLTIGITAITENRYLAKALDLAVRRGAYRNTLPPLSTSAPPTPSFEAIADAMRSADYRHWMAQQIWSRMPQTRLRPRHSSTTPDGPLQFTPGPLVWATRQDERCVIGFGDRLLNLPGSAFGFLRELFDQTGPIQYEAFHELDRASRNVVAQRLLKVGVLAPDAANETPR